jgi:hypothetical protein
MSRYQEVPGRGLIAGDGGQAFLMDLAEREGDEAASRALGRSPLYRRGRRARAWPG